MSVGSSRGGAGGAPRWPGIEEAIREGRSPDASSIAGVTGSVVELGAEGAAAESALLREQVLGFGPLEPWIARRVGDRRPRQRGRHGVGRPRRGSRGDRGAAGRRGSPRPGDAPRGTGPATARRVPTVGRRRPARRGAAARDPAAARRGRHAPQPADPPAPAGGCRGAARARAVGDELADVLRRVVAARLSFLVVGGTGAGKTTVLGALLAECAPHERVVVVEDVRELAPHIPTSSVSRGACPTSRASAR